MEILADKAPDPHQDQGLEKNPPQVAPEKPNWGWAGTPLKAACLRDPCKGRLGQWVTEPPGAGGGS